MAIEDIDATETVETTEETIEIDCKEESLKDKKVYIFDGFTAIAMTDSQVKSMVKQAKDSLRSGSTLVVLAETGKEFVDEETGITFVTRSNVNVRLLDGANIYILNHSNFEKFLNEWVDESSFPFRKTISVGQNTYNIYG